MEERLESVTFEDFKLFYEVYGEGETVILCLHGNSRSAEDFKFLARPDRKVISLHLFFHKHSTFSTPRVRKGNVHVEDVNKLFDLILEKENVNRFHLLAFSQGGRFSLAVFPHLAQRIDSFTLIAPDGLNDESFYSWSQRQWYTRMLFRLFLRFPKFLMFNVKMLVFFRVLHPKLREFMEFYTSDKELFEAAYKSWSSFRNIRPTPDKILPFLDEYQVPFRIIIGKFDQIIKAGTAKQFLEQVNRGDQLIIIPFGHNVFKPNIIKVLEKHLIY